MSGYVLQVVCLEAAPTRWTPWNGTYLAGCYPGRESAMERDVGFATVADPANAEQFATPEDALAERWVVDPTHLWRWDGLPNYPLAPFVLAVQPAP